MQTWSKLIMYDSKDLWYVQKWTSMAISIEDLIYGNVYYHQISDRYLKYLKSHNVVRDYEWTDGRLANRRIK